MSKILFRSHLVVSKGALRRNCIIFRRLAGQAQLMAVVKSNAYGHGLVSVAKILAKAGVDWLGVDDIDEALILRRGGIKKPILALGHTLPLRLLDAVRGNISVTAASLKALKAASKIKNLKIHVKLETGLNRQGITAGELPGVLSLLSKLKLEGVYSHFSAAELAREQKYRDYCNKQMDKFEDMAADVERALGKKLIKHMAGTAATMLLPRSHYDLVRVGIGMYGLDPTSDPKLPLLSSLGHQVAGSLRPGGLIPALSWYSVVAQVKEVKKGERVGYNLTERLTRNSKLAIVPVGYWQGYPRAASGRGIVLVGGKRCKIVGRISMDMMTIDVTDAKNVKAGDGVTLIGKGLSAEAVALKAGTINYELVTRINPNIPRIYK